MRRLVVYLVEGASMEQVQRAREIIADEFGVGVDDVLALVGINRIEWIDDMRPNDRPNPISSIPPRTQRKRRT